MLFINLHSMLDKNNSHFWHIDWHSDTWSVGVTYCRMLFPFLGPIWCIQLIVFTVKRWPGDISKCISCVFGKKHAAFKWKDAISRFPVSSGSADALVRWKRIASVLPLPLPIQWLVNFCDSARRCFGRIACSNWLIVANCWPWHISCSSSNAA